MGALTCTKKTKCPINSEPYHSLPAYFKWRPHEESNLDLRFRKPLFYPLNYGGFDPRCQFSLLFTPHSTKFISMLKLVNKKRVSVVIEGVCTIRHIEKNDKWEVDARLKFNRI